MRPAAYARSRKADKKQVQRAVASGLIKLDAEGRLDPAQADAAWHVTRGASRMGRNLSDDSGVKAAQAKIAFERAKVTEAQENLKTLMTRYAERGEALELARGEARILLDALRALPNADADTLAAALHVDRKAAHQILRKFIDLVIADLGDLEAQALRDVERA